jgi:methionyl-tRNA formyltransferase
VVNRPGLRVLFFGTPAFAVPTLEAIAASRHPLVGVVTQPDRPRGRGQKTSDAPVKARALDLSVPILQPARLSDPDVLAAMASTGADIGVVAAYGKILPEAAIAVPARGMINVHASLLPRYRGAAPIHRAILAGETVTGVTIMRVVKALDAGAMLATVEQPIAPDATSEDLERLLAAQGAILLVETLDRLAEGPIREIPQNDADATYASRLTKDDGRVDWTRPAEQLHNQIRGLYPWPHAFTFAAGRRIILRRSAWTPGGAAAAPGVIVTAHGGDLRVATGLGVLTLLELQAEGRRPASTREFLSGVRLRAGDALTPQP